MKLFVSVTAVLFAISCSFSFSADTEAILVGNRTYGKLKPKDMLGYVDKYILNKVKFSSCDGTYTQDIDEGDFERADIKCEDLPEKRPPALISMEKRYQYFEVSNSYKIFDGSGLLLNEVACSEVPKEYIVASAAANKESSSGILFSDEGLVGDQKYLRDVLSKGV